MSYVNMKISAVMFKKKIKQKQNRTFAFRTQDCYEMFFVTLCTPHS